VEYTSFEKKNVLKPLVGKISKLKSRKTIIIGLQGGQGTGKTTLGKYLKNALEQKGFHVERFSIDDFYKTFEQRKKLKKKHPGNSFYEISRGLPGTHRERLLQNTLQKIKRGQKFTLPIFDKSLKNAAGDVTSKTIKVNKSPDFVLFEGWFVGLPLVSTKELVEICKKHKIDLLKLDPKLKYHKPVFKYLISYLRTWKFIDYLIMLQPDSSHLHFHWRLQQEKELKKRTGSGMSKEQIDKFVSPYLPFTYVCYERLKPNLKILVNKKHKFYRLKSG